MGKISSHVKTSEASNYMKSCSPIVQVALSLPQPFYFRDDALKKQQEKPLG